ALNQDGSYGNKENDIENHISLINAGKHGVSRKHNRNRPAQSDPGNINPSPELHPDKGQRDKHAYGSGDNEQKTGDPQPDAQHPNYLRGENQQTQRKEQDDRHEPREPVKHFENRILVDQFLVSKIEPTEIHSEKAIARNKLRGR